MKLTVAITGASGIIYGKRLLEELSKNNVETHLVISEAAKKIIKFELEVSVDNVNELATHVHEIDDWSSPIVSGSYKTNGMVIVPCSMKTLAGIANGFAENAVLRAADVMIKEKRKLVLVPRETPISSIHLKNMLELSQQGVHIVPAMPAFYHKPENIDALVDFVVGRILDVLGIDHHLYKRWSDIKKSS
ncbi:MAG: UbiX family flavin prenyltransferase [Candidatus Bathyarchaeum tardum]|nr:MAG: UbiX family flavin prenyltransferase [Candidatus Bathyarchaeum tardum]